MQPRWKAERQRLPLASGAAAITCTIQALAQNGGHIVAQKTIYGGSYNLLAHTLPAFGITATFVNIHDLSQVEAAIQDNTRAIYIETLGNPNSDIPDIDALAALAHRHGIVLVADNTFGTPYLIRPIGTWGRHRRPFCDQVFKRTWDGTRRHYCRIGGILTGQHPESIRPSWSRIPAIMVFRLYRQPEKRRLSTYIRAILLRDTGACISPFAAFLLLQGIETLSLRVERHVENTKKVVAYLAGHPLVERVNHPSLPDHPDHALYQRYFPNGGGSIFTFEIKGGKQEAHRFIDHLEIFSLPCECRGPSSHWSFTRRRQPMPSSPTKSWPVRVLDRTPSACRLAPSILTIFWPIWKKGLRRLDNKIF